MYLIPDFYARGESAVMSLTSSSEKDLVEAAKKVGLLQRDRLGKQGNSFEWFQRMEAILRSHSLYYVVNPNEKT